MAEEVANELLSIFLLIGASKILQSDNGREFVNHTITDVKRMRPECMTDQVTLKVREALRG